MTVRLRVRSARIVGLLLVMLGVAHASLAGPVPAPWVAQDIGSPTTTGSTSFDNGTFTISAAGADIWGSSDQFHFVYQQLSGDFDIVTRVDSLLQTDQYAKVGLMVRSSLAANAANAFAAMSQGDGIAFQRRTSAGGSTAISWSDGFALPRWLRISRTGATVTGYSSTDGTTWKSVGSTTLASLGSTAYAGIAVTSHVRGTLTKAVVSRVAATTAGLPSPMTAADIGAPSIAGSTSYRQGVFTVKGAGSGVAATADQFHFVYQPMTGDGEVLARVSSVTNVNPSSKAGVMIRESLAPDARHAFIEVTAGNGYGFDRRLDPASYQVTSSGGAGAPPGWVRLVRTGTRIEAFRSVNGTTWTSVGTDTVRMAATVYVGIAVTSSQSSAATTATVDSFAVGGPSSPSNQNPTVALTSPANNASFTAPAAISIAATASDPEGRLSRVDFFAGSSRIGSATTAPFAMTWASAPAGTHALTAVAFDADGGTATSAARTVVVQSATPPPPPPPPTPTPTPTPTPVPSDCTPASIRCVGASQEYQTIQSAVSAAAAGDTVVVSAGSYQGFAMTRSGTSSTPIRVVASGNAVVNRAEPGGSGEFVRICNASYVTIEGLTVDASSGGSGAFALTARCATATSPMRGLTLRNNTVFNAGSVNIYLSQVADSLIEGNTAYGSRSSHGMYLANGGSDRTIIRGNTLRNNAVNGLHLNGDLSVGGDGIHSGIVIESNIVTANAANGLDLDGVQSSTIRNNLIHGNGRNAIRAFRVDGGGGPKALTIVNNTVVSDAGWGIKLTEDGGGGHLVFNNILLGSGSGAIAVEQASLLTSDRNVVVSKFSRDGDSSTTSLASWQGAGQDQHSIVSTPAAVFAAGGFGLSATSPAVDLGTASLGAASAPSSDISGASRPKGAAIDAGAYESR